MYAGNTSSDQWFAESWGMTVLTTLSGWVYFKLEGLSWGSMHAAAPLAGEKIPRAPSLGCSSTPASAEAQKELRKSLVKYNMSLH